MPIPLTILTGFLGAGKTTLLNYLLKAEHGLRIAVLVNDFGAVNIDSQLIVGVEGETVSLSNGCICCTIRDDLRQATLNILQRAEPPEYIIVETSGVSDPYAVALTFMATDLREQVQVDSILTVVDAEQIRDIKQNYGIAVEQLETADIVVVNKVDLVMAEELAALKTWIVEEFPRSRIIETTYGQIPLELVLGVGQYAPERLAQRQPQDVHIHNAGETSHHDHNHAQVFETWLYTSTAPLTFKTVREVVRGLPTGIYRAKGFVYLSDAPARKAILHVVGKRVQMNMGPEWGDQTPHTQLVVIGKAGEVDAADLHACFESCRTDQQPPTPGVSLDKALAWVRSLIAN